MAVEIELKARLDDYESVRERLFAMGNYCRAHIKSDTYWLPVQTPSAVQTNAGQSSLPQGDLPSGVRVRYEKGVNADGSAYGSILITYKTKEICDGIEVNDESEFTVSDAAPFEELLSRLGLREAIRKEKKGWAWLVSDAAQPPADVASAILAELSLVEGLGWFLEIEIQVAAATAAASDQRIIEESRRRLLALLETLEIPPSRIESRPYTVMLREKGRGSTNDTNKKY